MTARRILKSTVILAFITLGICNSEPYYGLPLGNFQTLSHNIKGEVFAVDSSTIFIKGFSYDGHSSDAVFQAGYSENPDRSGFQIPNDISHLNPIPACENQNFILQLSGKSNIENIRWLAVWNRENSKNLGSLIFLSPIRPPQPMAIGPLINTKHGVSTGDILIVDTQTIMVTNFNYDGSGKEAYWLLSKGTKPNGDGLLLLEHGRISPVAESKGNTLMLSLPSGHYVTDYDTLNIWSKSEGEHYGFVDVPRSLNIPPSLRIFQSQEPKMEDFNCEMLNDNLGLEVRWFIDGEDIIIHLAGNIAPSEYMALGLSKDDTYSKFDASDAIVTGIDRSGKGFAVDHYFQSDEKCKDGRGMCPDVVYGSQDNLQLLKVEKMQTEDGENFTVVKFKRRLKAEDKVYDQVIYTDGPQAILWAVGPLDSDGFAGSPTSQSRGNLLLDFGREPLWNCPPLKKIKDLSHEGEASQKETIDRIHCPSDHLFRAQLGPCPQNSSKKIWFINGIPTPDITIQRGITYTFVIEGGLNTPHHHPFYITSSPSGGLYKNILEANEEVEVTYAGIQKDLVTGTIFPTAEGRLCIWSQSGTDPQLSVLTPSREAKQPIVLNCEPGEPGKLIWTPTAETPDEVYYQSYTERNLGGQIRVVDFCEETYPHRYVEIATTKGGKPKMNTRSKNDGLERESESSEFKSIAHSEKESFSIDENRNKVERLTENASPEIINEKHPLNNDLNKVYNNIIISSRISSDKLTDRLDVVENQQVFENETVSNTFQETQNADEVFPHDESERSDKYASKPENSRKLISQGNGPLNSHRNADDLSIKYPTHSASETSSVSALGKPFSQEFKPQFEGGFIPLVANPMKEKESVQKKEFVMPSHHQNRPRRPFLYNESVPFHGTFKPGIPDFSGFNISNYSQDDASIVIAQENLALLTASKPQGVPRNLPPIGSLPLHLLHRPNDILPRPQRVQEFGPRFQVPHQQPSLVEVRKNAFPHLPINSKSNFPMPNIRVEDLSSVPSQRVYVSMQTTGDKKVGLLNIPNMSMESGYNRKVQNSQPNKIIYPPAIQRRPDFYEEKETNQRHPNVPPRKFTRPQVFPNINNKQTNQQSAKVPIVQSGMLQPQVNNRPKIPNSNIPINNFQRNTEKTMIPQRPLRHPYPFMNIPQRERIHQNPLLLKPFQIRSNPLLFEKLKMNDGPLNHPQTSSKILPLPVHVLNHNEKVDKEFNEPHIPDTNSSKEQRPFPPVENLESVETQNKNISPSFAKEKPVMNQEAAEQKLPFNETLGAFVLSTNSKSPQSAPGVNFHESIPLGNNPDLSNLNDKSINAEKDERQDENNPMKSNVFVRTTQNSENNRAQIIRGNNDHDIKYDDHYNFNSRPATFVEPENEKYILEPSSAEDFLSDSKEDPVIYVEYEHEDHPDSSDSFIKDMDYLPYNVPFGARLKFPENGSKIPVKSLNETPKVPSGITRRPQTYQINNSNWNSGGFIKSATTTAPTARSATAVPGTISTTTDTMLIAVESASSNLFNENQAISPGKEDKIKNLYYRPPFSTSHVNYQTSNSSIQDIKSSNEMKHIPIIADTMEDIIETGYIGRKNILLSNNYNSSFPSHIVPPKVSEDINLPQISDKPPTHDNRTDYSILNHVLALIGGPPN